MEEKDLWVGSPSQVNNLGAYIFCILMSWTVIPIFVAFWIFLKNKFHKIEITDQRIIETTGVFSKKTEELELYRVKDIKLEQPFFLRMFNLSNIYLVSSDRSHPALKIPAVPNGKSLREKIRIAVEARRDTKRVIETEFIKM